MRKEILYELYQYRDDYKTHDIGHLMQRLIGDGDESVAANSLSEMAELKLIYFTIKHSEFPQVNHNSIGHKFAGKDIKLVHFSINARILENGIKEVENDLLTKSTNATNESLRITNDSIRNLNKTTEIYYRKTDILAKRSLLIAGFTGFFILGQLSVEVYKLNKESTGVEYTELQKKYTLLQQQVNTIDSLLQKEKKTDTIYVKAKN